jgi:uncharacterized repeat protein (TIGR01451 family)
MKIIKIVRNCFLAVITYILLLVGYVYADGNIYGGTPNCVPVYGGGVSCPKLGEVLIDKKVINPSTGIYVDNLGPSDPKFRPQQIITFQVFVKNPGDTAIDKIIVTDTLPRLFDFMTGPGNYDGNTGKLTWEVVNLAPSDTQVFEIKGRISHVAKFPEGMTVICPTNEFPQPINYVDAQASNGQTDHDEARYCLEKEIQISKGVTPKAGPEVWFITIPGLLASLGIGLKLRKKTQ